MAQKNRTDLTTQANTIKNETANAANTATRVGTMHVDDIDSEVNWLSDVETDLTSNSDSKIPTVKAVVDGIAAISNELTADELAAINGANTPDATNVFLTENDEVYTKDADDNVFYKGVTGNSLGAGCERNIFHQGTTSITLTNYCINNIFEQGVFGFVFSSNLQNVTIKSGAVGADYTNLTDYGFLYSLQYSSEIFRNAENTANYHRYYDPTNDSIVLTLLESPFTVSYIGGGSTVTDFTDLGDVPSSYSGQANKVVSVKSDETGLEFTTPTSGGGDVYLANDQTFTGENTFSIGSGNDTPVTITKGGNGAGIKVTKSSGSGDAIEVAQGSLAIADETASRIAIFDANKRVKSGNTSTYPSLTELSYVKGVTSAIQTQLDNKQKTITSGTAAPSGGADGDIYLQYV
jgi:hypothetical protein